MARLLHSMVSDGRIAEAGLLTRDELRSRVSGRRGAAAAPSPAPAADGRHHEKRKDGTFQYGHTREVAPRSRTRGSPLPQGAPDCLAGLVFITTGTMETLWEKELIDLIERLGGEIRVNSPTKAQWASCDYLIRGYNGASPDSLQQGHLMAGRKVQEALKLQGLYEAGQRAKPLVILENEQAVFELIVRKSGGAAAAPGSSARTRRAPPEHGITKTELWSLTDFLKEMEGGGGGGGGASSSGGSAARGGLDPKPKTLVVVHGLHPGYAEARSKLFDETLKMLQQARCRTSEAPPPRPPPQCHRHGLRHRRIC